MINYLEKFNNLPSSVKQAISSEEAMAAIAEIENTYDVSLATIVMRVAVKDVSILDLAKFFVFEHEMDGKRAENLVSELKEKVFYLISNYLGFEASRKAPTALEMKIKSEIGGDIKKAAGSSFFFSSEDEEEVGELAKKVDGFANRDEMNKQKAELTKQMDKKLSIILNQLTVQFSSTDMTNRFKYVISSYIRGIRNRIDTRAVLKKDIENGGLGLDDVLVDRVLRIVDKVNAEEVSSEPILKPLTRVEVPEDKLVSEQQSGKAAVAGTADKQELKKELKLSGVRDMEYDFSKFAGAQTKTAPAPSEVVETPPVEIVTDKSEDQARAADDAPKQEPEEPASVKAAAPEQVPEEKAKPQAAVPTIHKLQLKDVLNDLDVSGQRVERQAVSSDQINIVNTRKPAEDTGRRRMEDVKYVPKLTGPIDELQEMSLVDFRRLSHDASVSVRKIAEKIDFLEEESFSQRLSGIKAWRQSPVNRLYLEIGQQSINNKIGVDEIINSRRNEGQEFLTNEEFASIMDLNKELRF